MSYRWKPNATQRKAFAQKMLDPVEQQAYTDRKEKRDRRSREYRQLAQERHGETFIPTIRQYHFCFDSPDLFNTAEEQEAMCEVLYGYTCKEEIAQCHLDIVNEMMYSHKHRFKPHV